MPRERISTNPSDYYDVSVGWHKDSESVQVASIIKNGMLSADGVSQLGLLEHIKSWPQADAERAPGMFASLTSRKQVNDLIRTLRKARDQAFGRDE